MGKRDTGKTFYILDEPTTGLHFEDIKHLLDVLNKLVDRGNTVLVIEHNMDVIKVADHIIDLGPEGGDGGGKILFEGTPEELISNKESFTAEFLKPELSLGRRRILEYFIKKTRSIFREFSIEHLNQSFWEAGVWVAFSHQIALVLLHIQLPPRRHLLIWQDISKGV